MPGTLTVDGVAAPDPAGALRLTDIAPGGRHIVAFRARIDDDGIATGAVLANVAAVDFTAAGLGTRDGVESAPASTRVLVPDLAITKTHAPDLVAGQPSKYTITVRNAGDAPSAGVVTVSDTLSPGLTPGAVTAPGWSCAAPPALICTRTDPLAPGAAYPPILVDVTPVLTQSFVNTVTVSANPDGDAANNTATDEGTATLASADLSVVKTTVSVPAAGDGMLA